MDAAGMGPQEVLCGSGGRDSCSRPRARSHTLSSFQGGKEGWCGWSAESLGESGEKWGILQMRSLESF